MPDLTTLAALQERLRAATGPSQELDALLCAALHKWPQGWYPAVVNDGIVLTKDGQPPKAGMGQWMRCQQYTSSVDAALALIAKVLPEANCIGYDKTPTGIEAYVSRNHVASGHWYRSGEHPTSIPIAFLLALVAALIAQEKANG